MNQINVMFFATLRDKAGVRSINLEIETGATVAQLKRHLVETYPNLGGLLGHCLVSINHEYCFDESTISDRAEVAFFPPVSGGVN